MASFLQASVTNHQNVYFNMYTYDSINSAIVWDRRTGTGKGVILSDSGDQRFGGVLDQISRVPTNGILMSLYIKQVSDFQVGLIPIDVDAFQQCTGRRNYYTKGLFDWEATLIHAYNYITEPYNIIPSDRHLFECHPNKLITKKTGQSDVQISIPTGCNLEISDYSFLRGIVSTECYDNPDTDLQTCLQHCDVGDPSREVSLNSQQFWVTQRSDPLESDSIKQLISKFGPILTHNATGDFRIYYGWKTEQLTVLTFQYLTRDPVSGALLMDDAPPSDITAITSYYIGTQEQPYTDCITSDLPQYPDMCICNPLYSPDQCFCSIEQEDLIGVPITRCDCIEDDARSDCSGSGQPIGPSDPSGKPFCTTDTLPTPDGCVCTSVQHPQGCICPQDLTDIPKEICACPTEKEMHDSDPRKDGICKCPDKGTDEYDADPRTRSKLACGARVSRIAYSVILMVVIIPALVLYM